MVAIKLFGVTKSLAKNQGELVLSSNGSRKVKDLVAEIQQISPELGDLILAKKVLVSVNQEIAHGDLEIQDGDEVALLPPFAGGAHMESELTEYSKFVRVQRDDFSIDEEVNRVRQRSKRIGGISVFLGTARDHSKGRNVSGITFEYYEGMAQKKLREIRERALKDFNVIEVLILHRYGAIDIGENIVLIVVGAEHRAEAFHACQWTITELKKITPIWKLEQTPEGEVWVEEHP